MDDQINDWLAQEYLLLQKTVEDFDARALTIKAWSVTFSAAGLGLAYQQHNPILLLIAALSAIVFWIVEAVWKLHQRAFYTRIREIEAHFALVGHGAFAPFQILRSWQNNFGGDVLIGDERGLRARLAVPFFAGVMLPHVVVAVAGVALYLVCPPA